MSELSKSTARAMIGMNRADVPSRRPGLGSRRGSIEEIVARWAAARCDEGEQIPHTSLITPIYIFVEEQERRVRRGPYAHQCSEMAKISTQGCATRHTPVLRDGFGHHPPSVG